MLKNIEVGDGFGKVFFFGNKAKALKFAQEKREAGYKANTGTNPYTHLSSEKYAVIYWQE